MHSLDNPAWHSLTGAPDTLRDERGGPLARRYHPDVAPFAALPDAPTPDAWHALRELVGPGNVALLLRDAVVEPDGWECLTRLGGLQMVPDGPFTAPEVALVTIGADDVAEMIELVERTRPGPFARRTFELGTYLGVRDRDGRLVAMAGERMRPSGYAEISAVCTDPAHRRHGLAAALVHAMVTTIEARGDQPFLHVAEDNVDARRAYEALGFTVRRTVDIAILRAPR